MKEPSLDERAVLSFDKPFAISKILFQITIVIVPRECGWFEA
jgi:hypothetical protein